MNGGVNEARRRVLRAGLAASISASGLICLREARADGSTRAAFHYQDHPNAGLSCSRCVYLVPGEVGKDRGFCRIIDAEVLKTGWCQAFRFP